jgi:hypothetical protein
MLIRVDENLKNLITEVKSLRENSLVRIRDLELGKVDRQELKDMNNNITKLICEIELESTKATKSLDDRTKSLERFVYIAIGSLGVIQLVGIPIIFKYFNL